MSLTQNRGSDGERKWWKTALWRMLVSAATAVKVKSTLHCFVSCLPAGENGNCQHRTNAVNTTLKERAERDARHHRARPNGGRSGRELESVRFHLPRLTRRSLTALLFSFYSLRTVPFFTHSSLCFCRSPHVHVPPPPMPPPLFLVLTYCLSPPLGFSFAACDSPTQAVASMHLLTLLICIRRNRRSCCLLL